MEKWLQGSSDSPTCMKIRLVDPLQQIALLLVDPRIMLLHRDQVKLEAKLDPEGLISGYSTTRMAFESERKIWNDRGQNEISPDKDIVIAIKIYDDGVSMGWGGSANTISVMGSLLNFDIDLQRRDMSKFVIGYIDNLNNVSEATIINHLKSIGMSESLAQTNMRYYYRNLENFFKEKFMESVKTCSEISYNMHILGVRFIVLLAADV